MHKTSPWWTLLVTGWLVLVAAAPALLAADDASANSIWVEDSTSAVFASLTDRAPATTDLQDDSLADALDESCVCADSAGGRLWVRGEYLFWWTQGNRLPPLVTTSPAGTPQDVAGVLGNSQTTTLFGSECVDEHWRSGLRLRFGYGFGCQNESGLEADLIGVRDGEGTLFVSRFSTGDPLLARPIIDAATGREDAQLAAFPELTDGQVNVRSSSELYSAAALFRRNLFVGEAGRWDLLGGYRYFHYSESLTVAEQMISRDLGSLVQVGTKIDVWDQFQTANDFHGGELGLNFTLDRGPWTLDLLAKVALGNVHQAVEIDGRTQVGSPGEPPILRTGGLLALPSNIGSVSHDRFAAIPEWSINVSRKVAEHVSLTGGYNWLLLSGVVRSGDQIDRTIDPSQLSPFLNGIGSTGAATRPQNPFRETAMWAQGVNVGLQLTY